MRRVAAKLVEWAIVAAFTVGVIDVIKGGWAATILIILTICGRALISMLIGSAFKTEIAKFKAILTPADPAVRAMWKHAHERHAGSVNDCMLH